MINHISIGVSDLNRSIQFYEIILDSFNYNLSHKNDNEASYEKNKKQIFLLYPIENNAVLNIPGTHIAFNGQTVSMVNDLKNGAEIIF